MLGVCVGGSTRVEGEERRRKQGERRKEVCECEKEKKTQLRCRKCATCTQCCLQYGFLKAYAPCTAALCTAPCIRFNHNR